MPSGLDLGLATHRDHEQETGAGLALLTHMVVVWFGEGNEEVIGTMTDGSDLASRPAVHRDGKRGPHANE